MEKKDINIAKGKKSVYAMQRIKERFLLRSQCKESISQKEEELWFQMTGPGEDEDEPHHASSSCPL